MLRLWSRNSPGASTAVASIDAKLPFSAWRETLGRLAPVALCLWLVGCAGIERYTFDESDVPPLKLDERIYTLADVQALADADILALNDEMRAFVELHTGDANSGRNKLMNLHWAVKGAGGLDIHYDPFADGDARDAFNRGSANCLSYAHMFIALAREAGLDARYQWMEVRPEWHRMGDRVAVRLHVNVQVRTRDNFEYMVDIDPLSRNEVAGARLMSDEEGLALYHNNLAMQALANDQPGLAWLQVVKGLEVAPEFSQLWVNLGAIYRYSGQLAEAEQAYFQALEIDQGDRSAMNNLVYLYENQGRTREEEYWLDRLNSYRERNPYYHASLGDTAMEAGDWDQAYKHYRKARRMQPDDGQLSYNLGLAEHKRGNVKAAEKLITQAIERASFRVERERYQVQLNVIREEQAAALL